MIGNKACPTSSFHSNNLHDYINYKADENVPYIINQRLFAKYQMFFHCLTKSISLRINWLLA